MLPKPYIVRPGQRWQFNTLEGKRTEYVVGERTDRNDTPAQIVQIVNAQTGGIGWVTRFWLYRDKRDSRGWFVFLADAPAEVTA